MGTIERNVSLVPYLFQLVGLDTLAYFFQASSNPFTRSANDINGGYPIWSIQVFLVESVQGSYAELIGAAKEYSEGLIGPCRKESMCEISASSSVSVYTERPGAPRKKHGVGAAKAYLLRRRRLKLRKAPRTLENTST